MKMVATFNITLGEMSQLVAMMVGLVMMMMMMMMVIVVVNNNNITNLPK